MAALRRAIIGILGSLFVPSATCGLSENLADRCPELEKAKHYIALSVDILALGIFFKGK